MGDTTSKLDKHYYDRYFGNGYGRDMQTVDFSKAFYVPYTKMPVEKHGTHLSYVNAMPQRPKVMNMPHQNKIFIPKPTVLDGKEGNRAKKNKRKKPKAQKHPIPGKTYYYYDEPDTIYVPRLVNTPTRPVKNALHKAVPIQPLPHTYVPQVINQPIQSVQNAFQAPSQLPIIIKVTEQVIPLYSVQRQNKRQKVSAAPLHSPLNYYFLSHSDKFNDQSKPRALSSVLASPQKHLKCQTLPVKNQPRLPVPTLSPVSLPTRFKYRYGQGRDRPLLHNDLKRPRDESTFSSQYAERKMNRIIETGAHQQATCYIR
jgi:hypothetical protein